MYHLYEKKGNYVTVAKFNQETKLNAVARDCNEI